MTQKQALTKACRLWGKTAAVRKQDCWRYTTTARPGRPSVQTGCTAFGAHKQPCPCGVPVFAVGHLVFGGAAFKIEAEGATWELAFERYEAQKKREHEEYEAMRRKHAGGSR